MTIRSHTNSSWNQRWLAAIDVQQHARQRTPRSSFAMHPAFPSPLYQPDSLQGQLQIEILLAIQPQYLLHHGQRNSFRRWSSSSAIEQTDVAKLLIALPPTTHVPVADADDLRRLPPGNPFRHRP